ncbi:MAG: hypothetical protein JRN18_01370 [Nitrososphaerota archaeon]|nr:hypothetical protein [Nitrososphaerota archaeon]
MISLFRLLPRSPGHLAKSQVSLRLPFLGRPQGLKVKTASARRAIDAWRFRSKAQVKKSMDWTFYMVAQLLVSSRRERVALIPLLVFASSFSFAASELVMLVLVGFFIAKLQCYRFVNLVLRTFQIPR